MITGGCLCDAVRYQCEAPPLFAGFCHCRDCQRASGAGHVPVLGVPRAAFTVTGTLHPHRITGGSGKPTTRNRCAVCGSLLFGTPSSAPDLVTIYAGSLDDPSLFRPTFRINTRARPDWDRGGPDLTEFEGMPPD